MRLLLERMSTENAELMSRERVMRQQRVGLESFDGKTFHKSEAEDRQQVRPMIA